MTCTQVTMYFSPTRKPVPSGSPSMCISPTLLLTFVFTSLDITSFCLWVPFEKGWVQANLVVTGFAFWKKKMNIFLSIWLFSCTVLVLYNFSIQFQFAECMEYFCRIYLEISNRLPWLQLISNIKYHWNKLDFTYRSCSPCSSFWWFFRCRGFLFDLSPTFWRLCFDVCTLQLVQVFLS